MTLDLKKNFTSTNKVLITSNFILLAFIKRGMSNPVKVRNSSDTKIAFGYNILLLFVLVKFFSVLIYIFIDGRVTIS